MYEVMNGTDIDDEEKVREKISEVVNRSRMWGLENKEKYRLINPSFK